MTTTVKQNKQDVIENYANFSDSINIIEMIRVLAETCINEIMAIQADELVEEGNQRNGYRTRCLHTPVGTLKLEIPKLRRGTFFPDSLLTRYSRYEKAIIGAVREMVINGISTRKVEKVAQKFQVMSMSKSQVSRICESLDEVIEELTTRTYTQNFPYLWLDATYLKCRNEGHVSSDAFVTAIAAGADGFRHMVGFRIVDTESKTSWKQFLVSLRQRGIKNVICVVSDAHEGLRQAIEEVFSGASWQRCIVHFIRNVSDLGTSKRQRKIITSILSSIFKETDPHIVRELYRQACIKVSTLNKQAAKCMEEAESSVLAYLDFPDKHWTRLRTNNVQERLNREIKRRSNVVQVFPSRKSCMRLVGAVLSEIEEGWQMRRWFSDASIKEAYEKHRYFKPIYEKDEIETICKTILIEAERKALDSGRRVA